MTNKEDKSLVMKSICKAVLNNFAMVENSTNTNEDVIKGIDLSEICITSSVK